MNRARTKLSARTAMVTDRLGFGSRLVRVAKSVEHRGIITTYKAQDRALGNRRSRRLFEHHRPVLDDVQQRVLADLERQEYAVLPFAELVSDGSLVERVHEEGEAFVAATAESLRTDDRRARDAFKDFLVHRNGRRFPHADSAWFLCCISGRLLDVANTYLRMWSKLQYSDFWYSIPVPADSARIHSQRWHRDLEDRYLLKAFLYLVDVDAGTGPFEFVAGSARGELASFYPWYPLSPAFPTQQEFEQTVPESSIRTFVGSAGTLILCNTCGFHRGGFATSKPRVLATATYCSPASLKALTERNYRLPRAAVRQVSGPMRYAVE
jgi:hypothetical protein